MSLVPILLAIGIIPGPMKPPSYSGEEAINLSSYTVQQLGVPTPDVDDSGTTDADLQRAYWSHTTQTTTAPPFWAHTITYQAATVEKYWAAHADLTGDGLTDLVYRSPASGRLKLARNQSSNYNPQYGAAVDLFGEGNFPISEVSDGKLPLKLRLTRDIIDSDGQATASVDYVRLQDVNGDGRIDIVDARNPGEWIAYINTPSAGDHSIYWMKTQISVNHLVDEWRAQVSVDDDVAGFKNGWISGARLPLSWTLSGTEKVYSHARAYEYYGWNLQNNCTHVSPLIPLETPNHSCAWERNTSADISWSVDGSFRSRLIFDTRGIGGDSSPELVGINWPQGFRLLGEWEPTHLQKEVSDPECRVTVSPWVDCEPGIFVAPAESPWAHYASSPGTGVMVLPNVESFKNPDPSQIEQDLIAAYDRFIGCYSDGEVLCNGGSGFEVPEFGLCYSWYGGRRSDLKPSDTYECYVEDLSKRWRGYTRSTHFPGG